MPGFVQLGGGAQSRRPRADHSHLLAGALLRRFGLNPAVFKTVIDDGALDVFDRHRRLVDAEHARAFAGRRTDPAGELREIVRLVQPVQRLAPQAAIDQIIPFRDEIVDGTSAGHPIEQGARVAEGYAAIHATGPLVAQLLLREMVVKLLPVRNPLGRLAVRRQFAQVIDESSGLAHLVASESCCRCQLHVAARFAAKSAWHRRVRSALSYHAGWPIQCKSPGWRSHGATFGVVVTAYSIGLGRGTALVRT